jgi:aryl-alcohol dehydrogenase-like predicted oxidoreductase
MRPATAAGGTIASAIAAGVNYFDTAVQYGNGQSEENLGRVLRSLKATTVIVGTKVRLPSSEFGRIADAVATSLEGSLARLSRECVDIFHLHNAITEAGGGRRSALDRSLRMSCGNFGCTLGGTMGKGSRAADHSQNPMNATSSSNLPRGEIHRKVKRLGREPALPRGRQARGRGQERPLGDDGCDLGSSAGGRIFGPRGAATYAEYPRLGGGRL